MRHRYLGDGGSCAARGWSGSSCGRAYAAAEHFSDGEHPYTVGDVPDDDRCFWVLQGPDGAGLPGNGLYCLGNREDTLHPPLPDQTAVLTPEPEGRVYGRGVEPDEPVQDLSGSRDRVFGSSADAPAEDGGDGSGSWAFDPHVPMAAAVPSRDSVNEEETFVAASARLLGSGQAMTWGPWPVRQFVIADGRKADLQKCLGGLLDLGEPWFAECWWVGARRVVRVQWGSLLMSSGAEVETAVASWPTT